MIGTAVAVQTTVQEQQNISTNSKKATHQNLVTTCLSPLSTSTTNFTAIISNSSDSKNPGKIESYLSTSLNASKFLNSYSQNTNRPSLIKIIKNNPKTQMPFNYTSSSVSDLSVGKIDSSSVKTKPTTTINPLSAATNLVHHKKIVVQASTNDLLNCFAQFIAHRCHHLVHESYINPLCYMNQSIGKRIKFEPKETICWLRSADCALLIQGWQEIAFMNPVNVVFVYLLVRDTLKTPQSVSSVYELQCNIMACLYLAFSYMGNEISYPLKPFLIEENRSIFWQRTCDLMANLSTNMLKINRDPKYFTELFYELKSYSLMKKSVTMHQLVVNPRNSISIENYDSQQIVEEVKHIRIDVSRTHTDQFKEHNGNRNFSSQKSLESFGGYDRRRGSFKNRSKSFYHGWEKKVPNHQVVFSNREPVKPVAYCI